MNATEFELLGELEEGLLEGELEEEAWEIEPIFPRNEREGAMQGRCPTRRSTRTR